MGKIMMYAAAALFAFPSVTFAGVAVSHERFKQQTEMFASEAVTPAFTMEMVAQAIIKDGAKTPAIISIGFMGSQRTWKYLQCHDVHWIVDGASFEMPQGVHQGQAESGYVIESIMISPISRQQLATLATGKSVDYEICHDEFHMTQEDHDNLAGLLAKMDESVKAQITP